MAKVTFTEKVTIGDKTFDGEMEFEEPMMGAVVDAAEICSPSNPVGFSMALIGAIVDVPYNVLRQTKPEDFVKLQAALAPLLPKV